MTAVAVVSRSVGGSFIACGLIAGQRRPDSRIFPLRTLTGFLYMSEALLSGVDSHARIRRPNLRAKRILVVSHGKLEELDAHVDRRVARPDKVRRIHLDGVLHAQRVGPWRLYHANRESIDSVRPEFVDACGGRRSELSR